MDNKLKKFKLEDGSVVDGGRIIVATSTNFCAVISLEGDTRLAPNSVQLSRDFIGRTDAQIGDLLYLDSDMNWAVSKEGWEEIEAQDPVVVAALNTNFETALNAEQESISRGLTLREENVAAREVAVVEAEGRLALRETALVEGETALREAGEKLAARETAVVEAETEVAKAKAELEAQAGSAKPAPSTKGIKVTGG